MPVLTKINTNVIADDAVTAAKIPADALGATDIAANAIGTSEIATGGVLPANIAYLGDGSGNLSGTITNQQLHFGTAFTLTDDLTVNGDVTLGKVRDDGTGQSITGAGKTLTGTGTLTMGSSIEGEPKNRTDERITKTEVFPPLTSSTTYYEEGNITNPLIVGDTTWTSYGSFNTAVAVYRRIGNMVFCSYRINTATVDVGTGNAYLTIPFTPHDANYSISLISLYSGSWVRRGYGRISSSSTSVNLFTDLENSTAFATSGGNSRKIYGSIMYWI